MSRYNQIHPHMMCDILQALLIRGFDPWLLPQAGREGTLKTCTLPNAGELALLAKSGSLRGLRSLAGYIMQDDEAIAVFSLVLQGPFRSNRQALRLRDTLMNRVMMELNN